LDYINYLQAGLQIMKLSNYPLVQTTSVQTFWTPSNTILIGGAIAVFITSSVTICSAIFAPTSSLPASTPQSPEQYATSIPWLQNKSECEHTDRTWSNGKCWDSEHNLMF
jgi:hypothetical protein